MFYGSIGMTSIRCSPDPCGTCCSARLGSLQTAKSCRVNICNQLLCQQVAAAAQPAAALACRQVRCAHASSLRIMRRNST